MIKFINIQNFQSHRDTDLDFAPGVNVIVGTTDSGKTAILRALRWVVWNRPSGSSFRSHWGGDTEVQVGLEGCTIVRRKGKAEEYFVSKANKKPLSLKAFGTNVPDEVSKELNISEINLQTQHDAPFLLSKSSGEVASHFNKIAKLDSIDIATANVNKWIRDLATDIKYKAAEQVKLEVQLSTFKYLDKLEIEIEVLEEMEKRVTNKQIKLRELSRLIEKIELAKALKDSLSYYLDLDVEVTKVFELRELHTQKEVIRNKIRSMISDIYSVQIEIEELTYLASLDKEVSDLFDLIENRNIESRAITSLVDQLESLKDISLSLKEKNRNLASQIELFKKEMPDTCPLCGSILTTNKKHKHDNN